MANKFNVGDRVKVNAHPFYEGNATIVEVGAHGFIDGFLVDLDERSKSVRPDGYMFCYEDILEPLSEDKPKFDAGERVVITDDPEKGVLTLKERCVENDDVGYGLGWYVEEYPTPLWVGEDQIALVDEEVTKTDEETTKFKAGDRIIVTEPGVATGQKFTLQERDPSKDAHGFGKAWRVEESLGWLGERQFEKVVEEPKVSLTVTKDDVVEYLQRVSDSELLDIIEEVRN